MLNKVNYSLKQISRCLVSFLMMMLLVTTTVIPNAHALTQNTNSESVYTDSTQKTPSFSRKKVTLGITPTGWSNSDDLSIDLFPPIPYQQILSEMAFADFKGTQGAPKFPKDMNVLKSELEMRGLTISEPWVGTFLTIISNPNAYEESKKTLKDQIKFMKTVSTSNVIVVAELGSAVHQQPVDPLKNRPIFTEAQWKALTDGLNKLGKIANDEGMVLCYHPHVGTGVQTLEDINKLMAGTDPKYVNLLLDTGHLYYSDVDPFKVTEEYINRIKHVHLKNIRKNILDKAKTEKLSFFNAIREGIFTVPGDEEGVIEFEPIFEKLAEAKYKGWLMVEAEQDPNKANPLKYALMARKYIKNTTGL